MRKSPKITVTFVDPKDVSDEEMHQRWQDLYAYIFRGTVKMMAESSEPEHIAFLKKYPQYLKYK